VLGALDILVKDKEEAGAYEVKIQQVFLKLYKMILQYNIMQLPILESNLKTFQLFT
jgi:hypothetical protein